MIKSLNYRDIKNIQFQIHYIHEYISSFALVITERVILFEQASFPVAVKDLAVEAVFDPPAVALIVFKLPDISLSTT